MYLVKLDFKNSAAILGWEWRQCSLISSLVNLLFGKLQILKPFFLITIVQVSLSDELKEASSPEWPPLESFGHNYLFIFFYPPLILVPQSASCDYTDWTPLTQCTFYTTQNITEL